MQKRQGTDSRAAERNPPPRRCRDPRGASPPRPQRQRHGRPRLATGAPAGHPVFAHHERISAAHAEFLRTQERVHLEFLAHRKRLLEWLDQAGRDLPPPATAQRAALPAMAEPAARPHIEAPTPVSVAAPALAPTTRESHGLPVSWDDWLLDSHVLPLGALFSALAGVASEGAANAARAPFGALVCELRTLGGLPGPGRHDRDHRRSHPAGEGRRRRPFRLEARVRDGGRPLAEVRGVRSLLPHQPRPSRRGPAAGAVVATHSPRTWATKRQFGERELAALHSGETFACFGAGFERAAPHTRTPPLPGARLVRLTTRELLRADRRAVVARARCARRPLPGVGDAAAKDDAGLRLGRVATRARCRCSRSSSWRPGATIARDGWRFESLEGHDSALRFFGAPPMDAPLEYELVVERLDAGPFSADRRRRQGVGRGAAVFRGERLALRLVPDFPLTSNRSLQADGRADQVSGRPAATIDGFRLDYASMVAGAVGSSYRCVQSSRRLLRDRRAADAEASGAAVSLRHARDRTSPASGSR